MSRTWPRSPSRISRASGWSPAATRCWPPTAPAPARTCSPRPRSCWPPSSPGSGRASWPAPGRSARGGQGDQKAARKKAIIAIAPPCSRSPTRSSRPADRTRISAPASTPAANPPGQAGLPAEATAQAQPRLHHYHHPSGGSLTARADRFPTASQEPPRHLPPPTADAQNATGCCRTPSKHPITCQTGSSVGNPLRSIGDLNPGGP